MRKTMQQRVALFLSFAMAFTSIDSSVLVSASDVTGIVSEEAHDHSSEAAQTDRVEEAMSAEAVALESEENLEDTETLLQIDSYESEGEQIIGEDQAEADADSSVDVAGPDESAGGEDSSSGSTEIATITRITGTPEKEQFISGLDNGGITFNTKLYVTYSDGITENCEVWNDDFTDRYGNTISFYLRNEDTQETKRDTTVAPMSAGTWYMICEIDGKEVQTEVAYHVVNVEDAEIPVLEVGTVTLHSGELADYWYQFVAPETGKYYFRTSPGFSVFQKTEAGIEEVTYSHGSFQATGGVTYYLGFQGPAKNETTGYWGNDWTTELAQVHGEISSVTDIMPEKEVYLNGMDFHMIAGTQITIHYPDRESKTLKWPDNDSYIDETGNAISIRLKRKDDSGNYSQSGTLEEGDYAVSFLVDGEEIGTSDYVYHLREASNVELPSISLGENEITSMDSDNFHNWYRFTPEETGDYRIDKYSDLNIYTSDGNFLHIQNGVFHVTGGETYYIGFRGPYPSDGTDYTWTATLSKATSMESITDITDIEPEKTDSIAGLEGLARNTTFVIHYANGATESASISDGWYSDAYENAIRFVPKRQDDDTQYNYWDTLPAGTYAIAFEVNGEEIAVSDYVYRVTDLESAELPELTSGNNTISSGQNDTCIWYRFQAENTGKYWFDRVASASVYVYKDGSLQQVRWTGGGFQAEAGQTYYIGFTGSVWDSDTEEEVYEWAANLQLAKEITAITDIVADEKECISGLENTIANGTTFTIYYTGNSEKQAEVYNSYYDDGTGNGIYLYLENQETKKQYIDWEYLPVGHYALVFMVGDQQLAKTDYLYTVKSVKDAELEELTEGENQITSSQNYRHPNWYRFTASKAAKYKIGQCDGIRVYHLTADGGVEEVSVSNYAFSAVQDGIYYIGFYYGIEDEEGNEIYTWTTELKETRSVTSIKVSPRKTEFYAGVSQEHVLLNSIELAYQNETSEVYTECDNLDEVDGDGNGFDVYLEDAEKNHYYNREELSAGQYTVHIQYKDNDKIEAVYTIQVTEEPTPFGEDEVTVTVMKPNKKYPVQLDEDRITEWFSYTPEKDETVQLQSFGYYNADGELYDASGAKLADNLEDGEDENFRLQASLQAGETYYLKARLRYVGDKGSYSVRLTELMKIQSLEVVEHNLKTAYPKGSDIPDPDVLLKVKDEDGSSDTFYKGEKYNSDIQGEVRDQNGSLVENLEEIGSYTYQLRYGEEEGQVVTVGEFQVVSLENYAGQSVAADQEQQMDVDETHTMRYQFTVSDEWIYQLSANVPFENLKVYDAKEKIVEGYQEDYIGYVALPAGTYYVVADVDQNVTSLSVTVKKATLPKRVTIVNSGAELTAGLDTLYDLNLALKVEYTDGTNAWIYGENEDSYGNYFGYKIKDSENNAWDMDDSYPDGNYTITPEVHRVGSYNESGSADQILKNVMAEDPAASVDIVAVKPDVAEMTAIAADQKVQVSGSIGRQFYTFTPDEDGIYTFEDLGKKYQNLTFCEDRGTYLKDCGIEINAKAGETYVVAATHDMDYQFCVVKKNTDSGETDTKTIQSVKICSDQGYVVGQSVYDYRNQLYLLVTYTDGKTELCDIPYEDESEDAYGNTFRCEAVEKEISQKGEELYLNVAVHTDTIGTVTEQILISDVEENATEVTTEKEVQASSTAYFKFVPEETGEYVFQTTAQKWGVEFGNFTNDGVSFGTQSGKEENNACIHQTTASLQKGRSYYFRVEEYRGENNIAYTLSVSKIKKQVTGLKIIDVPENQAAYAGIGVLDYQWLKGEVTYSDGSTETLKEQEMSDTGRQFSVYRGDWVNTETFRVVAEYGKYHASVDLPVKSWDEASILEQGTAVSGKQGEHLSMYSFTPSEEGEYLFYVDGIEQYAMEVYDSETQRMISSQYRTYTLEAEKTYHIAVYNYYNEETAYTVTVKKTGEKEEHVHKLTETKAKEATCIEDGTKGYWTCEDCGKVFADADGIEETTIEARVIPSLGHDFREMEWIEAKEPTCTEAGNWSYWYCPLCKGAYDLMETTFVPVTMDMIIREPSGHDWETVVLQVATDTEDGMQAEICSRCKEEKEGSRKPIPMTGHKMGEWSVTAEATCTEAGEKSRSCINEYCVYCKDGTRYTETEELPALGHDMTETEGYATTCTEPGLDPYWTCSRCGKSYADAAGSTEITVENQVTAALGHDMTKTEEVAPTCTEEGHNAYWTCNRCGKVFAEEAGNTETTAEDQILLAVGHQWQEKVLEEPTEDREGTTANVCENCGEVQENSTKILPKKGHTYTVVTDAATWTEAVGKAQEAGGHLATITTAAESTYIRQLLEESAATDCWIGGFRDGNQWKWITREEFSYSGFSEVPNGEGLYLLEQADGLWSNAGNEEKHCYVIEKDDISYTPDIAAPEIERVSPENHSVLNGVKEFAVAASDDTAVKSIKMEWAVSADELKWETLDQVIAGNEGTFSLDTTIWKEAVIKVRFLAEDIYGNTAYSTAVYEYTIDNQGPEKVTGLAYSATSTTITLSWTDVADDDFSYFQVEQQQEDGTWTAIQRVDSTLGINIYGLSPETKATYRVVAYDLYGNRGTESDPIEAATTKDITAPVVSGISPEAMRCKGTIPMQFTVSDDTGVASLLIQTSRDKSVWTDLTSLDVQKSGTGIMVSYTLDTDLLEEGSVYVRAIPTDLYGNVGNSTKTAPFVEYVIDRTAPAAPQGLEATAPKGKKVTLSWKRGEEEDLAGYQVIRTNLETGKEEILVSDYHALSCVDRNVEFSQSYAYRIRVTDMADNISEDSETVEVTIPADDEKPVIHSIAPASGRIGIKSQIRALVEDNNEVEVLRASYSTDGENWQTLSDISVNAPNGVYPINLDWNTIELGEDKQFYLKAVCVDVSGNVSEEVTRTYTIDNIAPEVSELTAAVKEDQSAIELTWTSGQEEDLAGFYLYRRIAGETKDNSICVLQKSAEDKAQYTFEDTTVQSLTNYIYFVRSIDKYGNSADSKEVMIAAPLIQVVDTTDPYAYISANSRGELGVEMTFSAAASYDDTGIVSYKWDFGDGATADTMDAVHTYEAAGTYEVTLTVADAAENMSITQMNVTIYDKDRTGFVRVRVHDENGTAISDAGVYFDLGSEQMRMINTNSDGYAELTATKGMYPIGAYKDGYLPVKKEVQITEKQTTEVSLTLVKKDIIIGDLTVRRMTLEEIKAAGIKLDEEANQNVFKFKTTLYYKNEEIPVEGTYSGGQWHWDDEEYKVDDRIIKPVLIPIPDSDSYWNYSGGGNGGSGGDGSQMTVKEPMIAVLEIPGEGSWLKDFFDVELTVLNQADSEFYVDNCKATLKVPSGLTLMDSNYTTASPEVSMGTIQGGSSASAHWILRGDEAGEYEVGADFSGTLRDFGASIQASFKVKEPFKVRGGENIWVDIITESSILDYTDGAIRVGIRNEDENPVYCPNLKLDKVHLVKSWKASGLSTVNTSREVLETGEELWYDYIIDRDDWEDLIGAEDTTFNLVDQITEQISGVEVNFTMKTVEPLTISPDKIEVYEYDSETGEVGEEVKLLDLQKNGFLEAEMPDLMIKTYRQDEYGKDVPASMDVTIRDGYLMRDDKPGNSHVKKVTTDENGEYVVEGYEITDWLPGVSDGNTKTNYKAYDIGFYSSRARTTVPVVVRGKTATTGNLSVYVYTEKENGERLKISGATVTVGSTSAVTGKNGGVDIFGKAVPTGKNAIRITADGYYPLEDVITIGEQTEKTYYLDKDDGLGHSFIKNLACSLSSNSLGNITIIPKGTASGKVTFTLDKEIVDEEEFQGYTYRISNGDEVVKEGEFTSNTFLLDMNDMDAGEKLYFGMKVKTSDGRIYQVPYRDAHFLVIERPNFLNSFTYDLNQATSGKKWSLKGSDVVKVLFSKDGKDTKVNIGSGTKDSSDDEKEDTLLKLLHQYDFEVENKKEFPVTASYDTSGKVTIAYALKQGKAKKQSGFYAISNNKEGDPERTSLSGDIKIQLTFTYNTVENVWDVAVDIILEGNVTVPLAKGKWKLAYAETSFEGNGELDLQLCKTEVGDKFLEELSDSFALKSGTIEGKIKGSVGGMVGMKELASLGAYFKVGLKMGFMPYMKMLSTVEVGWESHMLCFQNGGAWLNENYELFADSGTSSHELSDDEYPVLADEDAIMSAAEEAQENAGGYVIDSAPDNSQWLGQTEGTDGEPGVLAQGVYYDIQPQVVSLADGTTLMVFVNYTEDKNNPVGIYYTRKVNDSWTTPKRITTDGTIEMSPKLTKTESGASLIWIKLKDRLRDMSGIYTEEQIADALYEKMTVCQAYYDPTVDNWTTQEIASNGKLVSKSVWAGNGESSLSVWVENAAGAETATAEKPDTLHFVYRKGEGVAGQGEIQVPGYLISDLALEEADGSYLLTSNIRNQKGEKEIFYSTYDGNRWEKAETISSTSDTYAAKYIRGKLYYLSDRKILCAANGKIQQIVCSDTLEDVEDFTAIAYGEKGIILAWSESKYDGSIYMAVSQDGVRWSEPFAAVEQAGLCAAPQITVENGTLLLVYQQAITENGVQYELKSKSIPLGTDLKLMESSTDGVLYAGAEMRTDFKTANVGTGTVTGVKAVISEKEDGSEPIAETTVKNGLNGTIIWKVPEAYNGNTYYLVVVPADSTVKDMNMEDNAADIGGQMRDVAITYGSYMGTTAEGAKLLIGLENKGIVSSGGMSLRAENLESKELLYEGTLPDLAGGDERDISFLVDKGLSNVSILVTVTCDAEEIDEQNNTEVIRINDMVDLDETIQAHTHTWDDGEVVTEPTCTTTGEKQYHCTVEGCTESRSEVLPASHKLNKTGAKAATCTEAGNQEYWICSRCELVFADAEGKEATTAEAQLIPALGHDRKKTEAKEPTCTEAGNKEYWTCSRCRKAFADKDGQSVVNPKDLIVPALGHSYSNWTTKDPTCTVDGSMERTCTREDCGATESKKIAATGHTYITDQKEATCTEDGYTREICAVCKEENPGSKQVVKAGGHSFGEWEITEEATCTLNGEKSRTCSKCNFAETEVIQATGHTEVSKTEDPICTTDGYTQTTCSSCEEVLTYTIIPALGHNLSEAVTKTEPTCTEEGEKVQTCQRNGCGYTVSERVEALGHDFKSESKEATCTEMGYEREICTREGCGVIRNNVIIPATGHEFGEWTTTKEATCVETGMASRTCGKCEEAQEKELPKTDHSWKMTVIVQPTETTEGIQALICENEGCGTEKDGSRETIPMLGHTYSDWSVTKYATCTEDGSRTRRCTDANCALCEKLGTVYVQTEVIPATGHDLEGINWEMSKIPSCTEEGELSRTCKICNEKVETMRLQMAEHTFAAEAGTQPTCTTDGWVWPKCTLCGYEDTEARHKVPATGHAYGKGEYLIDPTCTSEGLIVSVCQNEGCKARRMTVAPELPHTWEKTAVIRKAATCTQEGLKDIRCIICQEVKPGSSETIAKTNHKWNEEYSIDKAATCTSAGQKSKHCSVCDTVNPETIEVVPATGHVYGEAVTTRQATCTTDGIAEKTCRYCGDTVTESIPKTGHAMEIMDKEESDCLNDGLVIYVCVNSGCGKLQYTVLGAYGHDFVTQTPIPATDTENGREYRKCSRCKEEETLQWIPSLNQQRKLDTVEAFVADDAQLDQALESIASMDEEIVTTDLLSSMEDKMTSSNEKPQLTGDLSEGASVVGGTIAAAAAKAATPQLMTFATAVEKENTAGVDCIKIAAGNTGTDADGKLYQKLDISLILATDSRAVPEEMKELPTPLVVTMKVPGDIAKTADFKLERISENGEKQKVAYTTNGDGTFTFKTNNFADLCLTAGTCTVGHALDGQEMKTDPASCIKDGKKYQSCAICGVAVTSDTIPATGHSWELDHTTPATCVKDGEKTYRCNNPNCSETKTENYSADHTYGWKVTTPATCTTDGVETSYCTVCGEMFKETRQVPATKHVFEKWEVEVPATCTKEGKRVSTCEKCGVTSSDIIPMTAHSYVEKIEGQGNGYYASTNTCSVCGAGNTKVVKETEHISEIKRTEATCEKEGSEVTICTRCGEQIGEPKVLPKKSHTLVETAQKNPTCQETGRKAYWTCTTCHQVFADAAATQPTTLEALTIPAAGHQLSQTPAQAATCVAEGTRGYWTCGTCGKVFADQAGTMETTVANQVLGKVAHTMSGYVETVHPTALATGVKTRTCSVCGYAENAEVAKLVSNVKLTTSKLPLQIKQKAALSKIVTGMAEGDYIASATSANKKIATVDNKGNVKGVKAGSVKITLNFASGTSRTVTVVVQKKKVATSKITVSEKNVTLKVKGKKTLITLISPITSKDKVTYKISNKKIATVTGKGVINAKKAGTAVITVKAGKKTVKVKVKVTK